MNSTESPSFQAPHDPASPPLPPADDGAGGAPDFGPGAFFAPALRGDAEQFPVLKAFQAYLEEERERARRRVVVVSASAIAAITVLVALFLVALGSLMRRNDQLNDRLLDIVAARPAAPVTQPSPPPPADPKPAPAGDSSAAAELQAKMAALEAANAAMLKQVEALQALPETLAASVGGMISNAMERPAAAIAVEPPAPAQPPVASARAAVPAPPVPGPSPVDAKPALAAAPPAPPPPPAEPAPIRVKTVSKTQTTLPGFRSESILLKTDAGVEIPWRIVFPE